MYACVCELSFSTVYKAGQFVYGDGIIGIYHLLIYFAIALLAVLVTLCMGNLRENILQH